MRVEIFVQDFGRLFAEIPSLTSATGMISRFDCNWNFTCKPRSNGECQRESNAYQVVRKVRVAVSKARNVMNLVGKISNILHAYH